MKCVIKVLLLLFALGAVLKVVSILYYFDLSLVLGYGYFCIRLIAATDENLLVKIIKILLTSFINIFTIIPLTCEETFSSRDQ